MTLEHLQALVERFASALETCHADGEIVENLRAFSQTFSGWQKKPALPILRSMKLATVPTTSQADGIGVILASMRSLRLLAIGFASKDLNTTLDSLLAILEKNESASIPEFAASLKQSVESASLPKGKRKAAPMDSAAVDGYVSKLEAALGDDRRFGQLLDEIEQATSSTIVAIASKFYGRLPKGTSRAKAIARIRERHEKLMEFKGQPSTAGRSAA